MTLDDQFWESQEPILVSNSNLGDGRSERNRDLKMNLKSEDSIGKEKVTDENCG
jgi:hypothetical protein